MIFKKKKMIDVGELQRRGIVRPPKKEVEIPTNREGFIEFGKGTSNNIPAKDLPKNNAKFFGFMDSPSNSPSREFSSETEGYSKREVDQKLVELDNKIYKLEQRVELLERKLDISNQKDKNIGPMGW